MTALAWQGLSDWRLSDDETGGAGALRSVSGTLYLLKSTLRESRVAPPALLPQIVRETEPETLLDQYEVFGELAWTPTSAYSVRFLTNGSASTRTFSLLDADIRVGTLDSSLPRTDIRGAWNQSAAFPFWPNQSRIVENLPPAQTDDVLSDATLYLSGVQLVVQNPSGTRVHSLGTTFNTSRSIGEPSGPASIAFYDHVYAILHLDQAEVDALPGSWTTSASSVTGTWDGELRLTGIVGSIIEDGAASDLQGALLIAKGPWAGGFRLEDSGTTWSLAGNPSFLSVDGHARITSDSWGGEIVGATLIGALLAWIAKLLLAPRMAFALGRTRRLALENPARVKILDRVREKPGISGGELMQTLGMPRGTFRFHIQRLCAEGLVRESVHGKMRLYELVGPSAITTASIAIASARRRTIVAASLALGGIDYGSFKRWLHLHKPSERPIGASTFSYHVGFLVQGGILQAQRSGGRITYSLNSPPQVPSTTPQQEPISNPA